MSWKVLQKFGNLLFLGKVGRLKLRYLSDSFFARLSIIMVVMSRLNRLSLIDKNSNGSQPLKASTSLETVFDERVPNEQLSIIRTLT